MEERVVEAVDWTHAGADTPVCEAKGIYLRDVVQAVLDGFETTEDVMQELNLTLDDEGAGEIPAILEIFVPVINMWRSGGGCGMGCAGCSGSCGG